MESKTIVHFYFLLDESSFLRMKLPNRLKALGTLKMLGESVLADGDLGGSLVGVRGSSTFVGFFFGLPQVTHFSFPAIKTNGKQNYFKFETLISNYNELNSLQSDILHTLRSWFGLQ